MSNALITLILFLISFYFINQQFSPKIVNTKKDNAKLWFVRFTSLYMLPVFSQLLNPTIPIVKEMGILGLLVPYIFCALIIYGLGYFFGRNKKSTSSSKKIKSFNSKNIGTEKIIGLILIGLLILGFVITYKDLNFWDNFRNPISQNNTNNGIPKVCLLFWDGVRTVKLETEPKNWREIYLQFLISRYNIEVAKIYLPKSFNETEESTSEMYRQVELHCK